MICEIQSAHDFILDASFLKYVLNTAAYLFYRKQLLVAYPRAFFDCAICTLRLSNNMLNLLTIDFEMFARKPEKGHRNYEELWLSNICSEKYV